MTPRVQEAFLQQATNCEALGSPFMADLMRLFAQRLTADMGSVAGRILNWPGDMSYTGDSVPLRIAGGLHALAILERCGLHHCYPPNAFDPNTVWRAIEWAFQSEGPFLTSWLENAPQTNEIRRSAPLIALGHWLTKRYGLPINMVEIGCSAGLNLMWDRFALIIDGQTWGPEHSPVALMPDWNGVTPPPTRPKITGRIGIDLNPLDPASPIDTLALLAYLWPDQPHRSMTTKAAIQMALSDDLPPELVEADAIAWIRSNLRLQDGEITLIYSTIAWQYLTKAAQEQGRSLIQSLGQSATRSHPLAWFQMEADGQSPGARLLLRLWPGDLRIDMGRADFHGRWVNWTPNI